MLRILAGTLLTGTILSGAAAGSFLSPAPIETGSGPSFLVMDEAREIALPVDATITASNGSEEPRVIAAPRYVSVSTSITAMPPAPDDATSPRSIASIGPETKPIDTAPRQVARELSPMVIRGGLVGMAFPGMQAAPAAAAPAQQQASPPERPAEPSRTSAAPAVSNGGSARGSSSPSASSRPEPAPPVDRRL